MPDRREFLWTAAGSSVMDVHAAEFTPSPGEMVLRETEPPNLETPTAALRLPLTPTAQFYVRNHFPTPAIDRRAWRLHVDGAVDRPMSLSADELRQLPRVSRRLTMECAGNGRVFLVPKVRGVNWANGAVGNAEWTGVPLSAVLDRAGVKPSAVEVVLEGADVGTVNDDPKSPGPIAFARSLPLAKARRPEVLLADSMNGEPLTPDHGAPLRAVVGGWYGMASVKWLNRIVVTDRPFQGFWQTLDYSEFTRPHGVPTMGPITAMRVKAVILATHPAIHGVAWAGESSITKVEISTDGGTTWSAATLLSEAKPFEWVHWEFKWSPAPGRYRLIARATDAEGRTQPEKRDPDRRTYQINHLVPVVHLAPGQ